LFSGEDIPGKIIDDSSLDEETKAKILGGNALEFLGLTKEQFM